MYNYNYIVFYKNDVRLPKLEVDGYQTLSLKDLEGAEDVHLVPFPLHSLPYYLRLIYFVCSSNKFKKFFSPKIKKLFYPYLFDKNYLSEKPLCFLLIGGGHTTADYLQYLKEKYPSCKIVCFYRNLIKVEKELCPDIVHNQIVDIEMTYDNGDAEKYGMAFCPEYSSLVDLSEHNSFPTCDVFFCGQAKDRYETLIDYYRYLTGKGLKCHFFITKVPPENQIEGEGLFYDRFLPYKEMLCRSVNSKCLLDINPKEALGGYTSRFYEAIMYNRKLISDNPITEESSFYTPKDIIYVTKPEDITDDFIVNLDSIVDYHYNGEFSPLRMIDVVENLLQKAK